MDSIVVDVETQVGPESLPNGWDDKHLMLVSVGVVYEHHTDRFRVYGLGDLVALQHRILKADRVVTFNGEGFDFPVIWGTAWADVSPLLLPKSDDILARIWAALGSRQKGWKAHEVGLCTIGRRKTGDGAEAPGWFKAGLWAKLTDYCLADVALERDLGRFLDAYGYLVGGLSPQRLKIEPWTPRGKQ